MCACSECAKNCGFTGSRLSQWLNLRQPISNDKLAKLKAWIANRAPPQMQSMLPAILSAGHGAGILAQYQFEPLPVRPPPVDRVSVEWHRAWQDRVLRIRQQHDSARAGPLGSGMASLGSMMSPMTDMMGFSVAGVFIGGGEEELPACPNIAFCGRLPHEQVPELLLPLAEGTSSMGIAALLKMAGLVASSGEGNRLIDGGGVRVDSGVVSDKGLKLGRGAYLLQVGKRKFVRVTLN